MRGCILGGLFVFGVLIAVLCARKTSYCTVKTMGMIRKLRSIDVAPREGVSRFGGSFKANWRILRSLIRAC